MKDIGWPPMDWKLFSRRLQEIREHYDEGRISRLTLELAQMVGFLANRIKDKEGRIEQLVMEAEASARKADTAAYNCELAEAKITQALKGDRDENSM